MLHFEYLTNGDIVVVQQCISGTKKIIGNIDFTSDFFPRKGIDFVLNEYEKEQLRSEREKQGRKYTAKMADLNHASPTHTDNDIKPAAPKPVLSATNPSHYKFTLDGKEYDIDQVIVALRLPWRLANAMKYIARAGKKDDEVQDVSKAITYCEKHIKDLKK